MQTVKVGHYNIEEFKQLDPTNIKYATQSNLLSSLYGTLLFRDELGQIQTGLAESYKVRGPSITFTIRDDITTKSGYRITAKDVYLSFLRLLVLNKNTHGNLKYFIACEPALKSLSDLCPNITYEGSTISFTLKNENMVKFFLGILVNPDFSVLPANSFDQASSSLTIKDYSETSGPYYIAEANSAKVLLHANKDHYLIRKQTPKEIEVVGLPNNDFVEAFIEKRIDIIPTFAPFNEERRNRLIKNTSPEEVRSHKTLPIKIRFLRMYSNGPNRLSLNNRLKFGQLLKSKFREFFPERFALNDTNDFFSSYGAPTLSEPSINKLKSTLIEHRSGNDQALKGLHGAMNFMLSKDASPFFDHNQLTLLDRDEPGKVDFGFNSMDAGFFDSLSHLAYCQSRNYLAMSDNEFESYIYKLMTTQDSDLQIKMLQDLHFKILSEGYIIPIGIEPYYAFARKPWKLNAYKMYAGSPLWMIEHE